MKNYKVYINNPKESWITDRFRNEWYEYNKNSTKFISSASSIWLIAPWTWMKISKKHLSNKKVVCTIHHIDFSKFDNNERKVFFDRDKFVDFYHVPSKKSYSQLSQLTNKKIYEIPFWVNPNIFYSISTKDELRKSMGLDKDNFYVGSFQRDTEGKDLLSPKLSKGPDLFISNVLELRKTNNNLFVVLTGYRRQYIISELEKHNIPYKYYEKPNFDILNKLYNCLNLYIVSSRVEGGPAAIIECAISKTPIVSTNVGIAEEILHKDSIYFENDFNKAAPNIEFAYSNALKYSLERGMLKFNEMFEEVNEN